MFSGCPKLPWSTLGCDVPWHNKVRRHSRTRQEQRRSKKPSQSSSFSGLVPPAPRNANLPNPLSPHRARSRARDRFLPGEGEKKPPSLLSFTSVSQSDSLFTSNGQSSITSTIGKEVRQMPEVRTVASHYDPQENPERNSPPQPGRAYRTLSMARLRNGSGFLFRGLLLEDRGGAGTGDPSGN